MLFKSPIFSQASGSVNGLTFSHNKGGQYTRGRAIPTNPNTPAQLAARNAMAQVVDAWTNVLTQAQRDAWSVYATNTPVINRLGDSVTLSGQQMYIRSNSARVRAGVGRRDDGPVINDLGTFTTPSIVVSAASPNDIEVTFDNSDAWAIVAGGFLFVSVSRGQNQSINFFKAPFQQAGRITGAVVPPTSPETLVGPFPYAEGQKIFATFRASQSDGRLSNNQIVNTIATA